jgi:hypothetical protein
VLVFREVKAEKRAGVGLVGPISKVNFWVGGEDGLAWDSDWNVNGWNAAVEESPRCAARCWKLAWTFDSELASKIEGCEAGAVACTGSESGLSVCEPILQARSDRLCPVIGVGAVVFEGACGCFLIVTYLKSPV